MTWEAAQHTSSRTHAAGPAARGAVLSERHPETRSDRSLSTGENTFASKQAGKGGARRGHNLCLWHGAVLSGEGDPNSQILPEDGKMQTLCLMSQLSGLTGRMGSLNAQL